MSLIKPLTVSQFKENAGNKIKGMGAERKQKLRKILIDAVERGATINGVAADLKKKVSSSRDKKRNWVTVARTEYTDAKSKAAYELLKDIFGEDHSIYRECSPTCCTKCKAAFGTPQRPRKYRLGDVPSELIGATHPNCDCGPWKSVETPDLTKAMHPLADVPAGVVRRIALDIGFCAEISTGTGYWVRLDSMTGRSIARLILINTPLILVGESRGFHIFAHGRHNTKGSYELYDLAKIGSVRFYPQDFFSGTDAELREKNMSTVCDMHEYMTKIMAALPTVATMPEYWENGEKFRYLTDFMGYKTLTDFFVILPGHIPKESFIKKISSKEMSQRRAIRSYVQYAIESSSMKKANSKKFLSIQGVLKMMEDGRGEDFPEKKVQFIKKNLRKIAPRGWRLSEVDVSEVNRRDPKYWKVSKEKIKKYTKMDLKKLPPIVLTYKGYDKPEYFGDMLPGWSKNHYTVIDGNHRHEAAIAQGNETIMAWIPIE